MKKTTIAAISSTLVLGILVSTISSQAATLPAISSIVNTIQGYLTLASDIVTATKPSPAELAAGTNAVSDGSFYGVSGTNGVPFPPVGEDGQINLNQTDLDASVGKFVDGDPNKLRLASEYRKAGELITYQNATKTVAKSATKLEKANTDVVVKSTEAMSQAKGTLESEPVGTCDSSLCADNTSNILKAKQINLQIAAVDLAILNNAYSKINNNQQVILLKSEQDKKAEELVDKRIDSIMSGYSMQNRINADRLYKTAFK